MSIPILLIAIATLMQDVATLEKGFARPDMHPVEGIVTKHVTLVHPLQDQY